MKHVKLVCTLIIILSFLFVSCQDSGMISSDQSVETMPFSLEGELGADLVFNEDNGHYYKAVEAENLSWTEAWYAAADMNSGTCVSYLATSTSQEENEFITTNFPEAAINGYWLGGNQLNQGSEPDDGWVWITGETWDYTNWANNEPNNFLGNEDALHFYPEAFEPDFEFGVWNDQNEGDAGRTDVIQGYVVEVECPSGKVAEKVTGSGHFNTGPEGEEELRTFSFNARKYENGVVAGEYQLKSRAGDVTEHGDITCLSISEDGTQAWLGGIIERNDPNENIEGLEITFIVEDNGQGRNSDADKLSLRGSFEPGGAAIICRDQLNLLSLNEIEKGNITIH